MASRKNKKVKEQEDVLLCEGIYLGKNFFEEKENRMLTLFIKGLTVYLLTMGSIGFYLSAFSIPYNVIFCNLIIFVMAMLCAMLYYRLLVENMGYLLILILFGSLVFLFRTYINSGFYAIVNITVEYASQYFDVDVQRLYTEQITNRYVTVSFLVLFLGIVLDILLNVYISRRMQYVTVFFIIMFFNLIPLYFIYEPNIIYATMLLAGMTMAYVFKSGKHYSPQVSVKRNNDKYIVNKKEKIDYVYDVKSMLQAGLVAFVCAMLIVIGVRSIRPVENFNIGYKGNKYKDLSMAAISTFMLDGFSGFSRYNNDAAGLESGRLGNVGSVRIDNETDLTLVYTPYSYDTLYLKSFVGDKYNPYENCWTSIDEIRGYDADNTETETYRNYYENGGIGSAKGTMLQNTVDAYGASFLMPYYGEPDAQNMKNGSFAIKYYPVMRENECYIGKEQYESVPYSDQDLYVPEENREAVSDFVDNLDRIGTDEQNIQAVIDYFQENVPYTIKPGKTPRKKDFVNYFLTENKKGYCAHYASAAVLIFRSMGIPARYIEGYSVSYDDLINAELVDDAAYSDYYDGYSEIGETGVVKVNVTDASAHAWVEVYTEGKGWHVVDVTPVSDEEEANDDFWDMFDKIMGSDEAVSDTGNQNNMNLNFHISDKTIKKIGIILLELIAGVGIIILIIKNRYIVINSIKYKRAGTSDKLVIRYSMYCQKLRKKDKQFAECYNYHTQVEYLDKIYREKLALRQEQSKTVKSDSKLISSETMEKILERAGYSNKAISEEELEAGLVWIHAYMR